MPKIITEEEFNHAMTSVGLNLTRDILRKCITIAINHNLSAIHFADSWQAYSLNKNVEVLNMNTFSAYRNYLLKNIGKRSLSGGITEKRSNSTLFEKHVVVVDNNFKNLTTSHDKKFSLRSSPNVSDIVVISNNSSFQPQIRENTFPFSSILTSSKLTKEIAPRVNYSNRCGSGITVILYNPNDLPLSSNKKLLSSLVKRKCEISQPDFFPNLRRVYKHLFCLGSERAAALDQNLNQLSSNIIDNFRIPVDSREEPYRYDGEQNVSLLDKAPLESLGTPRQSLQTCIGRICNDAHEGKLNISSILLEGSYSGSNGERIPLDVTPLLSSVKNDNLISKNTDLSLFSGQVVAVEGINTTGHSLVARHICEGVKPPSLNSESCDLLSYHYYKQNGEAWKLVVAAGPFTPPTNLEYRPFLDLLRNIKELGADVVILMGPFVDLYHPMVSGEGKTVLELVNEKGNASDISNKIQVSHEMLFASKVTAELEKYYEDNNVDTQFILIPSIDDAVSEPVYPQPPLLDHPIGHDVLMLPGDKDIEMCSLGLYRIEDIGHIESPKIGRPKRVHCMSNPCTFRINELTIGLTSTDALLHISKDETNGDLGARTSLDRLSQHFLLQRSYYPSFPPPLDYSIEVNLDLRQMKYWSMPYQPDILLLPSKLPVFASHILDGTIAINPGHLMKDSTWGTFAVIDVYPMKKDYLDSLCTKTEEVKNILQDRIRVEIKRI